MTIRAFLLTLVLAFLSASLNPAFAAGDVSGLLTEADNALAAGDLETALERYRAVLATDPDNAAALEAASMLSADLGYVEVARDLLIQRAESAADRGDKEALAKVNAEINALQEQVPQWINDALDAAGAVDQADMDGVEAWQEMTGEARAAVEAGDFDAAVGAQESALLVAEEVFGPEHWITVAATRDLGFVYRQAGMAEEAEAYYSQALGGAQALLGDDHPQTLEIASLMAELYSAAGMIDDSMALYSMTVAGLETSLGDTHPQTIGGRVDFINLLEMSGQYDDAVAEAMDLCGDIERDYGRFHRQSIECLDMLGRLYMTTGALADAEKTYDQIAVLAGASFTDIDPWILNALTQLAEVYRQQGRYEEGKDLLSNIIQLALQTGNVESGYVARSYLGRVLNNQGEFDLARQVTEEVLDYGLEHWQDRPLEIYNTLLELGAIYQAQGKLADAEATFEEAYQGLLETYGENHPSTLVATNNLGQIYEKIGLYDQAEPVLKLALERFEQVLGPAHPDSIRARNNLAALYESQGNFREAEPLYLESLELMREVHGEDYTDTVAVKNNLAFLYMLMEDFEKSAQMFEEVMMQWQTLFGSDHQNTLKATNNLARVYKKLGRLDEAETLFLTAFNTRSRVLGEDHLDTIRSMIDLGGLYLAQGRLDEARDLLTDALERAERVLTEQHPYTFDALNLLAQTRRALGDLGAALDLMETGMRRRSEFLDRMLWATGQNAREGYIRLHRPELDAYLSLIAEVNDEESGKRLIDASLQRKGLLLKVTSEIQQIASLSNDPEISGLAQQLEAARRELASLTLSGPTAETRGRHAQVLYDLEQQVNELQGELGRASVRYRTSIAQVSVDTLEGLLEEDTGLVDFLTYREDGQEKLLAGVMVNDGGEVRYGLARYPDRKQVQDAVINYRTIIQDDLADEFEVLELGQIAHELIWAPVEAVLDGVEQVYVIPDGVLNILPFNALVDGDDNYLIQTHDLRLLTSARDLLPNQFELAQGEYVILAGPDYDSDDVVPQEEIAAARGRRSTALQLGLRGAGSGLRGLSFSPLPGAEEEGRIISEQVEQYNEPRVVYFGEQAQEEVLSQLGAPPEILHMATHGFFLEPDDELRKRLLKLQRGAEQHVPPPGDNPLLRAGMAFAGVNTNAQYLGDIDTDNDGVLTALEVLDLDLSGTQLVVLSACETGLGEIHEGEGVYGLRRSFQEAGVAEVVSSLWEVSDAGTQALMTEFYDRLLAGEPAREALRATQLSLMDDPRWGYPYIWSAFMIVGSYESAGFTVQ